MHQTGADVAYAGIGVIYSALNEASTKGAAGIIGGAYLLILLLLWRAMGRVGATGLTLATVGVGAIWLMGAYGLLGRDINMVTMVMPTLVLVIGVSDCVHMLTSIAAEDPALPTPERVRRGIGFVMWPCLLNTITTAVGFLALATSAMPVVRDLGIFCALGLFGAFAASLVLCVVAPSLSRHFEPRPDAAPLVQRAVNAAAELAIARPTGVLAGAAVVGLLAALSTTRIVADTYSIDYLAPDHQARIDSDRIEATYGPYTPLEFVVERAEGVQNVDTLAAIAAWQDALVAPTACTSPARGPMWCAGSTRCSPPTPLLPCRPTRPPWSSSSCSTPPIPKAPTSTATSAATAPKHGSRWVSPWTAPAASAHPSRKPPPSPSCPPTPHSDRPATCRSMCESWTTSCSRIWLWPGIRADLQPHRRAVPQCAPRRPGGARQPAAVLLTLGFMGLLGFRLDVATVTFTAIVLGLVVDDSFQFLYRYRHEARQTHDPATAIRATVRGVGRPMALTSAVLGLGFSVLALAAIKSVAWFGMLLAAALFSALFCDVLVLPAFLMLLNGAGQLQGTAR